MKLVIDIPQSLYQEIMDNADKIRENGCVFDRAIINGTPLPKSHGRLIDADELCNALLTKWETADKEKEVMICAVMADIVTPIVVGQNTIIEADTERSEDDNT